MRFTRKQLDEAVAEKTVFLEGELEGLRAEFAAERARRVAVELAAPVTFLKGVCLGVLAAWLAAGLVVAYHLDAKATTLPTPVAVHPGGR